MPIDELSLNGASSAAPRPGVRNPTAPPHPVGAVRRGRGAPSRSGQSSYLKDTVSRARYAVT